MYYKKDYQTRTEKGIKKFKRSDGSVKIIEEEDNIIIDEQEGNNIDSEKKQHIIEKISMSSANITQDEWNSTSKDRLVDIKNVKSASSAIDFFKKWPPYVDNCVYVCIIIFLKFKLSNKLFINFLDKMGL